MWDYIVLGQIPGTSVQITFAAWLFLMACMAMAGVLYVAARKALASDTAPASLQGSGQRTVEGVRTLTLAAQLVLAYRVHHVIATAAYSRRLMTRQQIKA